MDDKQLLLEEWKERYASYRAYRTQYLSFLSFAAATYVIALALGLDPQKGAQVRFVVVTLLLILVVCMIFAHVIARSVIRELGDRMERLERQLGISAFRTTRMLERSLVVGFASCMLALCLTIGILIAIL